MTGGQEANQGRKWWTGRISTARPAQEGFWLAGAKKAMFDA